jgi:riboflavin kinase
VAQRSKISVRLGRSSDLKVIRLEGKVFSGTGGGSEYFRLVWVKKQVEEQLGFSPYVGTLNIRLNDESIPQKRALTKEPALEIVPDAGYCRGKLFKAILKDCVKAAVVVPDVPDYPEYVLEVISSENLRKKLQLSDRDKFEVRIIL